MVNGQKRSFIPSSRVQIRHGPIHPNLSAFDSGNLYGYMEQGGAGVCPYCGSVFEISPDGNGSWKETDLWDFTGQRDGDYPTAVVLGPAGQVYGANFPTPTENTIFGGEIFELTPRASASWKFEAGARFMLLHRWDGTLRRSVADASGNSLRNHGVGWEKDDQALYSELSPTAQGWKESVIYSFGTGFKHYLFSVIRGD